jgi:hypothetical protein
MTCPPTPSRWAPSPRRRTGRAGHERQKFVIYDRATKSFTGGALHPAGRPEERGGKDPRLLDAATGQPRKLPLLDRENKTVTLYSKRQKVLTRWGGPNEYLSLPESAWEAGRRDPRLLHGGGRD